MVRVQVVMATPSRFELPISALTGRRVRPLHHGAASISAIDVQTGYFKFKARMDFPSNRAPDRSRGRRGWVVVAAPALRPTVGTGSESGKTNSGVR